jgi:superfamily II DNA or RNA helicase
MLPKHEKSMSKQQTDSSRLEVFLAHNSTTQSLEKGLEIYKKKNFQLISLDPKGSGLAAYKVSSERGWDNYSVSIRNFIGKTAKPVLNCSCPYDWGGLCKHRVAALMDLNERGFWAEIEEEEDTNYDMLDSLVLLPDLSDASLRANSEPNTWKNKSLVQIVDIISAFNGVAETKVKYKGNEYVQRFSRQSAGKIHSSCACGQKITMPLCAHKLAALSRLRDQYGLLAFESMRDWTAEKAFMLNQYGYTLDDDLSGKFDFKVNDNGKLEMKVLDKSIKAPETLGNWWRTNAQIFGPTQQLPSLPPVIEEEPDSKRILLYSLTFVGNNALPDVSLVPLTARYNELRDKLSHVSKIESLYSQYGGENAEMPVISAQDSRLMNMARNSFSYNAIATQLRKQGLQMPYWYYSHSNMNELSREAQQAVHAHIGGIWERIMPLLRDKFTVISTDPQNRVNSLKRVNPMAQPLKPRFEVREEGGFAVVEGFVNFGEDTVPMGQLQPLGFWLRQHEGRIARVASYNDALLMEQFGAGGAVKVKKDYLPGLLSQFVLPLTQHYSVDFLIEKDIDYRKMDWKAGRIYLKEDEAHLMIVPTFAYTLDQGFAIPAVLQSVATEDKALEAEVVECTRDGRKDRITYDQVNDQITVWERKPEAERPFIEWLEGIHPEFSMQAGSAFFYLPFGEVLKNHWLFQFFEAAKEQGVEIFGFAALKKFKYNPNRPKMQVRASSGIDWFDMKMEVAFGDQFASLADIRKAIIQKQQYIQLADGSIGMLPQEWIERYANLFKFGQVQGDKLQVSKLHFSVIDQLSADIDNEKLLQELAEKKQKLLNFREIQDIPTPANIKANLRDYQQEGFKWLNFLEEFRWGGCLADDMGLGKTVQVLTLLQELKDRGHQGPNLIVMPTTLIFNWQAEVQKFAPTMSAHVHRGITRQRDAKLLLAHDLVLTTYGTLRSDVEFFKEITFNYIVLDESQAIKNPGSLTAKAVKLLQSHNRLVMTGTPVENNTFDLYSQMDFLNPGLLGSQEFFKSEFANPIDKHRDATAAAELRKLIYPFILKRTKEEVAKDLPDKTETVLFCEMDKRQRKVYETFRDTYRARIVEKMETEGKEKSAFLILEGLLKLRQICDSPLLLSDDEDYGSDSVKLDEIIREIEENAGNHKILIFSQFLKMLDLVKQHLEKAGITYQYLDGQTRDRADRVNDFQNNDQCRIFLMSLKAGGVGINLTEADYVYLIDPWWNPAVEQQAIDRTHRIGQTRKVFAYRMICKDTVEEKILELQAKKKDIAKDLISTEEGLLKKLSKDDIVNLFS